MYASLSNQSRAILATVFSLIVFTGIAQAQVDTVETAIEAEATTTIQSDVTTSENASTSVSAELTATIAASSSVDTTVEAGTFTAVTLSDRTKERITNLAANISSRLDVAVDRMQNITTRLQARIDKLTDAGLDTAPSTAILASANASLAVAEQNMATIDLEVNNAVNAENPTAAWQEVKSNYLETRDQLRTAQSEIRATIEALKVAANTERSNNESIVDTEEEVGVEVTSETTAVVE